MKDISHASVIIPDKIASFVYKQDKGMDILHKILSEWKDVEYVYNFYTKNSGIFEASSFFPFGYSFTNFSEDIMLDLEQIEDFFKRLENKNIELDKCFAPLSEREEQIKILSLRKRRCKWLRIYAIRIDENLYAITGGAIKITKTMQEHEDTKNELAQLQYTRDWLRYRGIETDKSFYLHFDL